MKTKERGSLNILKSRYVVITLAAVLCLTVIIGAAVKIMQLISSGAWQNPSDEKAQELLAGGGEIVFPFGQYSDIVILDGERGIFGVKEFGDGQAEDGEYKPVDAEGNHVEYDEKQEYDRFQLADGNTTVIDTATGEEVFHTVPGEFIAGRFGEFWLIDGTGSEEFEDVHGSIIASYFYALDDKFSVALDGMIFSDFIEGSSYMLIQREKGVDYATREDLYGRSFLGGSTEKLVINTEGKEIYCDDNYDDEDGYIRGIAGNVLIKGNGETLTYIDMDKMAAGDDEPVIRRGEKIMCRMDFEDGSAAACLPRYDKEQDIRLLNDFNPKNADVERQMAKYKWGIVDENFEPITSMDFDGAYASENGYAVVIYDGSKALIRLKGGGKVEQAG